MADVIIIGAGAAGLFCAAEAARRGRSVVVLEREKKPGKKIIISGGGRCNFTNYDAGASAFISENPHFCKSALSRYTQYDFIDLVEKHGIAFHEKKLGQLFCDNLSREILDMLLAECKDAGVEIILQCGVDKIKKTNDGFEVFTNQGRYHPEAVVIASGGLSIPKAGASGFGYEIAQQFGHRIVPTDAGLVPFLWKESDKHLYESLPGISLDCRISTADMSFEESLLFTHKGLSGPAVLQMSSYWKEGEAVVIDLLPELDDNFIEKFRREDGSKKLKSLLTYHLPKRLIDTLVKHWAIPDCPVAQLNAEQLSELQTQFKSWQHVPGGTEGYRTAEVTTGGVDTAELSSKTMESKQCAGLYFIGEVVDVTGWLGGYNFQWAWSSAWCAGQVV